MVNKRRYVVRRGNVLMVFSNQADALNALPDHEVKSKQYPAKKRKAPITSEICPVEAISAQPDTSLSIAEIERLASLYSQQAQYRQMMQQRQYEALLTIYERWKEQEEEDELMLLLAA